MVDCYNNFFEAGRLVKNDFTVGGSDTEFQRTLYSTRSLDFHQMYLRVSLLKKISV